MSIGKDWALDPRNYNIMQVDETFVTSYNGVVGDDFELFYNNQQAPDFVPPDATCAVCVGSPQTGLTNAQLWATHGNAAGGKIATCATTRANVRGFACPTSAPLLSAPMTETLADAGAARTTAAGLGRIVRRRR